MGVRIHDGILTISVDTHCSMRVGRADDCDIAFRHPTVSRYHADLVAEGAHVKVVDRSTNGTFVNGRRAPQGEPVVVTDGAELSFGRSQKLTVRIAPAEQAEPALWTDALNKPSTRASEPFVRRAPVREPSTGTRPGRATQPVVNDSREGDRTRGRSNANADGALSAGAQPRTVRIRPELRSASSARQRAKREAIVETVQRMLPQLAAQYAGQFLALHSDAAIIARSREDAEAWAGGSTPRVIVEIPTKEQLDAHDRSQPEPTVHDRNIEVLEDMLEVLRQRHLWHWIAIHKGNVLEVNADRHLLIERYYREEYIPVLIAQIVPGSDEFADQATEIDRIPA